MKIRVSELHLHPLSTLLEHQGQYLTDIGAAINGIVDESGTPKGSLVMVGCHKKQVGNDLRFPLMKLHYTCYSVAK